MVKDFLWKALKIKKFVTYVFPLVDKELQFWLDRLEKAPCSFLAGQARASIAAKRFHALGGSVFSLYSMVNTEEFIRFVVALQTISDYLDNLCDRSGIKDEKAFRQLHLAMLDALDEAGQDLADYYLYYPYREDGGYLNDLVYTCKYQIQKGMPAYHLVKAHILELASLYNDLQSLKHLSQGIREKRLVEWARPQIADYPGLSCWEFGAATGSTLGIFMLAAAASSPVLTQKKIEAIKKAYFPWIGGFHILLDYFIDQEEDLLNDDLNFVYYYPDTKSCCQRLGWFCRQSKIAIQDLPLARFHLMVIEGLLSMYLSDPKALRGPKTMITRDLQKTGGSTSKLLSAICRLLRKKQVL